MRKVVVTEFMSLDGVFEDPGGAEKFKYGGWTMPYVNEEFSKFKLDERADTSRLPGGSRHRETAFCRHTKNRSQAGEIQTLLLWCRSPSI